MFSTLLNAIIGNNAQETHSAEYRSAYLAISAYKTLLNNPLRTNRDTTTLNAQKTTVRETLADVTDRDELAELRAFFNA